MSNVFFRRLCAGLAVGLCTVFSVPAVFALSDGCAAVNDLSGATSLSLAKNRYPASDFLAGDTLALTFTDSGQAYGGNPVNADSVSLARYSFSGFQTYNAAHTTSSTPHQITISVPTGSLEANGLVVRASTSHGQISNLVFTCNSSPDSD